MKKVVCYLIFVPCLIFTVVACKGTHENAQAESEPEFSQPVTEAVQDLANRLGVSSEEIVLVKEESVTWRDGSLGCPKANMMYTQALIEGALIVLRVDGRDYQYHSGNGRESVFCETPEKPMSRPSAD